MLARVQSYLLQGIDALPCEVEVDHDRGGKELPPVIVGLPDAGVRESLERVHSALDNSGYPFAIGRVVINLAPADVRKEGPVYDLPMAVGLLVVQGILRTPEAAASQHQRIGLRAPVGVAINGPAGGDGAEGLDYRTLIFGGELALDGRVRPIKGAIAMAAMAKARGAKGVVVPAENAAEAAVVSGVDVYGVRTLTEVVGLLTGNIEPQPTSPPDVMGLLTNAAAPIDFAEVRGQEAVKRAIVVAAAGGHNLLGSCPSDGHGGLLTRGQVVRSWVEEFSTPSRNARGFWFTGRAFRTAAARVAEIPVTVGFRRLPARQPRSWS